MRRCWSVGIVDVAVADMVVGGVGDIGYGSVGDGVDSEACGGGGFVLVGDDGVVDGVGSRKERGGSGEGTRGKSSDERYGNWG